MIMTSDQPYPDDGAYCLRQKTVHALKFDGTKACAHKILAYVFERNGSGHLSRRTDTYDGDAFGLHIEGIAGYIHEGSWIISLHEENNFIVMNDIDFKLGYEQIPPQGLTPRGGELGGGF